jgi:glycosyltransferase involved in cell wall biosynthesis
VGDIVVLQHENGIFGGASGSFITCMVNALRIPLVTILHTVIPDHPIIEVAILQHLSFISHKMIVMGELTKRYLEAIYAIQTPYVLCLFRFITPYREPLDPMPNRMEVIPHGAPDIPYESSDNAKIKFGFEGSFVIMCHGLLSPGKGIETVVMALPIILRRIPNAILVIAGKLR